MKKDIMKVSLGIAVVMILALFLSGNAFSEEKSCLGESMTITGTIAADSQIIDQDGQIYMLGETDKAQALSALVGTKVELKGTVLEKMGGKEISVTDYKVLTE
ncbi:MAG: hypothetical protein JRJ43_10515 [Deltaproteobacteria bacterium]|nr:hypothetical protein [Deltaproteobacteria bacterium]MBW1719972.1 hypothetical protein [Deltaproteobacteria bacterium]MBW1933814.1 hypothetical protein [Deltaproteobacteria bacterium]MBW1939138.1 hypothetical protein [Deltaproteobacteria bacterium]MBW2351486.1 hypothetical protein [Deltaproteobacteria bacterium]